MEFLEFLKYINSNKDGFLYTNKVNGVKLIYNDVTCSLVYYKNSNKYFMCPNIKTIYDFVNITNDILHDAYQEHYRIFIINDLLSAN